MLIPYFFEPGPKIKYEEHFQSSTNGVRSVEFVLCQSSFTCSPSSFLIIVKKKYNSFSLGFLRLANTIITTATKIEMLIQEDSKTINRLWYGDMSSLFSHNTCNTASRHTQHKTANYIFSILLLFP
jgi:hypothetical protein